MIPRIKPCLNHKELIAILKFWQTNAIQEFENAFAQKMGQKYAISFPYGRTALIAILKTWGLKNKEIICPAYTCVVVAHAIVKSGNVPVFIDCQESDFNMNLNDVEKAINQNTGAIIATSLFGYPVDLDHLDRIRTKYSEIKIIQDCAHSFSAEWDKREIQKSGDCAFFGLNISKMMTSIFGGIVTTDNKVFFESLKQTKEQLIEKPKKLKSVKRALYIMAVFVGFSKYGYRFLYSLLQKGFMKSSMKYYDENMIDMPEDYLVDITNLEARVGLVQLSKYDEIIKHRRETAQFYDSELMTKETYRKPSIIEGATYSHYTIRTSQKYDLIKKAAKHGLDLGEKIEYCVPHMNVYKKEGQIFPIAEQMTKEAVNLPFGQRRKVSRILNQLTQTE